MSTIVNTNGPDAFYGQFIHAVEIVQGDHAGRCESRSGNDRLKAVENELLFADESYAIRGAVYEVYKTLGSGYLEEVYQNALEEELTLRSIPFEAKKPLHVNYKGRDCGTYEPDFICYGKVIVEIKSVDALHDRHLAQLHNYLSATGYRLGLLVNFSAFPKVDIRRHVL